MAETFSERRGFLTQNTINLPFSLAKILLECLGYGLVPRVALLTRFTIQPLPAAPPPRYSVSKEMHGQWSND